MRRVTILIEEVLPSLLLAASVLAVCTGVVGRYVFNHPLPLVNELAVVALVWQVFLGATAAFRLDTHVRIPALVVWLPERLRYTIAMIGEVATIMVLATTAWLAWQFLGSGVRSLPMTGWSYRTVNSAVLIGLGLGALHATARLATSEGRRRTASRLGEGTSSTWDEPTLDGSTTFDVSDSGPSASGRK